MRSSMLAACAALACACGAAPLQPAEVPRELPRDVRPLRYGLELTLVPDRDRFQGEVAIEVALERPADVIWLHALDITISDSWVDASGDRIAATFRPVTAAGLARLTPARAVPAGRATLHLTFEGAWNDRLPGLYRVRSRGATYAYSQLEVAEARRVFPGFDEPAFRTPFDVSLVVPEDDVALSNTPAVSEEKAGPGLKRVRFESTAPFPTHLVFAAAGPFEVVTPPPLPPGEVRARPLPVRVAGPRGSGARLALALEATRRILPILERWLGLPFPHPTLDLVVSPDLAAGALEFGGAILGRDEWLAFDPGESPEEKRVEVGRVLARELALQWLGYLATPASREHAWINESLAQFLAWKALESWRPDANEAEWATVRIDASLDAAALPSARAPRQLPRRTSDVEARLDDPSARGAALLRTFERFLGEAPLRDGIRAHLRSSAPGAGTSESLPAALSRSAGRDLAPTFRSFLDQPGAPLVEAHAACDAGGPRIELTVTRDRLGGARPPADGAFEVPVCARYEAAGTLGEACTLVGKGRGVLALPACPRWVMPAAGGTVGYRWAMGPADMGRLRDAGLLHLTAAERLSYAQALRSAARAGRLPYAEALLALAPLARDGSRRVATSPMPSLAEAIEHMVPEQARSHARARAADLYRPRLRELGLEPTATEPPDRSGLRRDVAVFLLEVARDPETTRALGALGLAYAQVDRSGFQLEALSPDLAPAALSAAVAEGDPALFEALERRLHRTEDGDRRARILAALGSAREPALSESALALARDPRLRGFERVRVLLAQASRPETRVEAWKTLEARWDTLVQALAPSLAEALPAVAAGLCDRSRIPAVQRFLARRVDEVPGARRHLEQAVDTIELCAALREAQGASAAAYFSRP